jgi:hypothetical protein
MSAALGCVAALAVQIDAAAADPAQPIEAGPESIAIVGAGQYQAHGKTPEESEALGVALRAAREHPDDLSYPWVDPSGKIVRRWVTQGGQTLLSQSRSARAPALDEQAPLSYRALESIKDDVTTLARKGVHDADTIWRTEPDDQNGRIIITVTKLSRDLLAELAVRYGTRAVAVHVDPQRRILKRTSRDNDSYPFSGGARISRYDPSTQKYYSCTSAFAWSEGMLTAGHCAPQGGTLLVGSSRATLGATQSGVDENFETGYGTVPFPGQTALRGDLALVRTPSSSYTMPSMYVGGVTSNTRAPVTEMWNRSPELGDQYCTGGATSGELCGWTVATTRMNILTDVLSWEWLNNVTEGVRFDGKMTLPGDSGGPVYTVQPDGTIAAKGITSSGADPPLISTTFHYFTDIWEAYYGLPGVLRRAPRPPSNLVAIRYTDGYLGRWVGPATGGLNYVGDAGGGWNAYNDLTDVGDITGDGYGDLVAVRRTDGCLARWSGDSLRYLTYIGDWGCGWGNYTQLTGVGDITGDGVGDLVGVRKSDGCLARWAGNRNGALSYFGDAGCGWNNYTSFAGVGDITGDLRGDLVAVRISDGCLARWAGRTGGGLAYIGDYGCGWNNYAELAGVGDISGDGVGDLVAIRRSDFCLAGWTGGSGGGLSYFRDFGCGWGAYSNLT